MNKLPVARPETRGAARRNARVSDRIVRENEVQAELDARHGKAPVPGEVFELEEGEDARVRWAVLWVVAAVAPRNVLECYVVPLEREAESVEAPWDFELTTARGERRVARCDLGFSIDATRLRRRADLLGAVELVALGARAGVARFAIGALRPARSVPDGWSSVVQEAGARLRQAAPRDPEAELRRDGVMSGWSSVIEVIGHGRSADAITGRWLAATNPVWYLAAVFQKLFAQGGAYSDRWYEFASYVEYLAREKSLALPTGASRYFARESLFERSLPKVRTRPPPRVVGLTVDRAQGVGFVCSIRAEVKDRWRVAEGCPFDETILRQALDAFFCALGRSAGEEPYRGTAFEVDLGFGHPTVEGRSLDVTALLALLDAACGCRARLFECATSLVELAEDRRSLVCVKGWELKLAALMREFDEASLVVCTQDVVIPEPFARRIGLVLRVETLDQLAAALHERGALEGIFRWEPLDTARTLELNKQLDELFERHRHAEVITLSSRMLKSGFTPAVATAERLRPRRARIGAWIRLGEPHRALEECELGRREVEEREGEVALEAEMASAAASSLYYVFGFVEAERILAPWEDLLRDPRRVRTLPVVRRAAIINTLARLRALQGGEGWRELFDLALGWQTKGDEVNVTRTRCELLRCLLWADRLTEAEELLGTVARERERFPVSEFSRWVLTALEADLRRRQGIVWESEEADRVCHLGVDRRPPANFYLASYLQATARQPGRSVGDARARLVRAREIFLLCAAADATAQGGLLEMLGDTAALLRAGLDRDASAWGAASSALRAHFDAPSWDWRRRHLAPVRDVLDGHADLVTAGRWADRIPML